MKRHTVWQMQWWYHHPEGSAPRNPHMDGPTEISREWPTQAEMDADAARTEQSLIAQGYVIDGMQEMERCARCYDAGTVPTARTAKYPLWARKYRPCPDCQPAAAGA